MELQQLPLFPLNAVLFPGMPLPLHIFEDRYKRMIGECQEHQQAFGVVLIKSGSEVGAPAHPRDVGTTAQITVLTPLEEGRMNLLAVGQQRFRIFELVQQKPYLVGQVAFLEEPSGGECDELAATLAGALTGYLDSLFAMLDQEPESFELPTEAGKLSYVTASVLQIGLEEKQTLLEIQSTRDRLRRELQLLRRETDKLATVLHLKERMGTITPFDTTILRNLISPN